MDLSKHNIFEGLDTKDFEHVLPLFKEKAMTRGEHIFKEGEEGLGMFFIIEGSCRVEKTMPDGRQHVIATLEDGELFGEMAIVTRGVRTCDCLATSTGRLWFLPTKEFDLLQQLAPKVWLRVVENINKLLCGRLTAMTDEVCTMLADLSDVEDDVVVFEQRLSKGKESILDVLKSFGRSKVGIPSLRGGQVKEVK